MKRAPRFPSRWAGRMRTLGTMAVLSVALGACNTVMGAREGTMEYPGSGAGPNAVPVYVVKDKDTVEALSFKYGVPIQTIVERNKLQPPNRLRAGQTLEMPGAKYVPDSVPGADTAAASTPGPVKREGLAPPAQGEAPRSAAPAGQPTPLSPASQSVTVPATPPPRFVWPVQGKVVGNYGTTTGGQKNDGIDIQTEKGAPVKAADGGTVVYAGNEVRNMGNLVLVSHPGGWITAYANNESLLVKKGDAVKKGQAIAKADTKLHFEVRRSNKTLDPTTVLPAQ
ncbi:MAG: LysM peptidoglycan-binding domain-containing protein [Reyranella sp.]|nr:MAG: LysM peptidoglycan-binding domain-containing protein [Reyranella sp.]